MARKAFLTVLLFAIVPSPISLPAQDSPCTKRTIAVGVVDRQWRSVQGLSAANFRGKLQSRYAQILSAAVDNGPRRIVVLMDASGSMMEPAEQWQSEKSMVESLIRYGPRGESIALVAFAATVVDTETFEQEPEALIKNLGALLSRCERRKVQGQTALYDAMSGARGLLGTAGVGDVIYALTDTADNKSRTEPKKLRESLLTLGVRLFGVVTEPDFWRRGRSPDEDSGRSHFHSMVSATGGSMLNVRLGNPWSIDPYIAAETNEGSLNLALLRLYEQMGKFYRLDVRLPQTVDKPTKWKLEVVDADGKPMRGVEVHYPQELMPCKQASP